MLLHKQEKRVFVFVLYSVPTLGGGIRKEKKRKKEFLCRLFFPLCSAHHCGCKSKLSPASVGQEELLTLQLAINTFYCLSQDYYGSLLKPLGENAIYQKSGYYFNSPKV